MNDETEIIESRKDYEKRKRAAMKAREWKKSHGR